MKAITQTSITIALGFASPAFAQDAELSAHGRISGGELEIHASIEGASGPSFTLLANRHEGHPSQARVIGHGVLDPRGEGQLTIGYPGLNRLKGLVIDLSAVYLGRNGAIQTEPIPLPLGGEIGHCEILDFDFTIGPDEPEAGQIISDQWGEAGIQLAGDSNSGVSPDQLIIFDSSAPTGGDTDLATPGYGPGNDTAYGNLLILAENVVDANNDNLVDNPDDDAGGGVIAFTFAGGLPVDICSITVVDIDDANPSEVRFVHNDMSVSTLPLPNAGDNSVQTLTFFMERVLRMEVELGGSGGIAEVLIAPCPILLSFQETIFGRPLGFLAGLEITNQFQALGLNIQGANFAPGHPDKVILFDSANPTGGDGDLITPGYGLDNDTALGHLLIIAENDIDLDMDGHVDDPDDEERGGRILFDFDETVTFIGASVLDVDGTEVDFFTAFDENLVSLGVLDLENLGDNSVQRVEFPAPLATVKRVTLTLGGSGAVTHLRWCPDQVIP